MTSPADHPITLELVVRSAHPALLEGLDVWLQLGLVSDEAVRQICAENLVCALRQPAAATTQAEPDFLTEFPPVAAEPSLASAEAAPVLRPPSWLAQMMQSFMAELSVVWLLFLGVFMVVVSSGVLAASQWRNFPPVGQYGILLAYTLAFWVVSVLTGRRANLRLTSRMLQIATVLMIPVNFWMMDSFHLIRSGAGFGLATIAALLLTTIIIFLLRPTPIEPGNTRLLIGTAIVLSWLHWGWGWADFPLVAAYCGTISASLALVYQDRMEYGAGEIGSGAAATRETEAAARETEAAARETADFSPQLAGEDIPSAVLRPPSAPLSPGFIAVAFSTLLLIARAVFVVQVPITRLGLAAGICGWLLCWLSRWNAARRIWAQVGTGLLLAGWFVAVMVTRPWQAIAISGLGLWLLGDYLRRSGQAQYLTAVFLVGLQAVWLLWRILPLNWQQWLITIATQLAGPLAMPESLLGLWFFPYLLLTVVGAFRLRRWQRPDLAKQAELLALGLGIVLLALSSGNSLVRSINLVLSTLTLVGVVSSRRPRPEVPLIYLTHATGLAAIAACIHQLFPHLNPGTWATILLVGMLAEWGLSALGADSEPEGRREGERAAEAAGAEEVSSIPRRMEAGYSPPFSFPSAWRHSAWYFGLALSTLSYLLLAQESWGGPVWGGRWIVTPVALCLLGYGRQFWQSQLASWLSVFALFLAQSLIFDTPAERLLGFGIATVLMVLNTQQLRHGFAAWITIWFGLGFAAISVWEALAETLTIEWGVSLPAIAGFILWLLWSGLARSDGLLPRLYQQAVDIWAITLIIATLLLLTLCNFVVYLNLDPVRWQYTLSAAILFIAVSLRLGQASLRGGFYLLAWSLELLITGILGLSGRSLEALTIANLALGLVTQLLGEGWMRREARSRRPDSGQAAAGDGEAAFLSLASSSQLPASWDLIPLLYAGFGLILAHRSFTATTGLYTLTAALVGIGIGRRPPLYKPLTFLSVFAFSFGAYELLLYQISQAKGGSPGDAIVPLAALAGFLAIVLRLFRRWLVPYLRLTTSEVQAIAVVHWTIGNAFLLGALLNSRSPSGEWGWVGVAAILAGSALVMGNGRWVLGTGQETDSARAASPISLRRWTYAGITEATCALAYLFHLLLPDTFLLEWGGAIAAVLAFLLYLAPWQTWGWQREPWRHTVAVLPAIVTTCTAGAISLQGLLIVAAFYAWLAKSESQVRLSYLSILLADWAAVRFLSTRNAIEPLWLGMLLSASLLYVVQIDPALRSTSDREKRHLLRCLATGLVCATAFYQSEIGLTGIPPILVSLLSIGLALGFILTGIWLRIRAFLFIGTLAFIIQILRQLWLFINDYSLLLWAVIGAVGLVFMWIAATFEARRTQVTSLVQYWSTELDDWE